MSVRLMTCRSNTVYRATNTTKYFQYEVLKLSKLSGCASNTTQCERFSISPPRTRDFESYPILQTFNMIQFFQRNPVPKTSYILFNTQDSQNYPLPETSKSVLKTINIIFVPQTFNTIFVPITLLLLIAFTEPTHFYRADSLLQNRLTFTEQTHCALSVPCISHTRQSCQSFPVPQTSSTTQYHRPPVLPSTTDLQHYPVPQTSSTTQYHRPPTLSNTTYLQYYPVPQTSNIIQYHMPSTLPSTTDLQHYPVPDTFNTTQYHRTHCPVPHPSNIREG